MVKYGLIGRHLGHSFSARFFNDKFRREGINAMYTLYELEDIARLRELLKFETSLRGLNVTIPYKQEILREFKFDFLAEDCKEIGAVNTVKIIREGENIRLEGYNTDVIGFGDSLSPLLAGRKDISHALVLGAGGGAAKAVEYTLRNRFGIGVTGVSRHPDKGRISYRELTRDVIDRNLLIVNCTPLGMWPDMDTCPDIPYKYIGKDHVGFDLVYRPEKTLFMKKIGERGAIVINGLKMLYCQAEAAWKIWNP